jgi:hypothetical protein
MLAFAMHLIEKGADHVELQPDGEHNKRFGIREWFTAGGYGFAQGAGITAYAGTYSTTIGLGNRVR